MPRGASAKREKEYDKLKHQFEEEGRYPGREEEVAARIVNKQRAEYGETKEAKKQDRKGESPDNDLPIRDYDELTVDEIAYELEDLSEKEIRQILDYEKDNKRRKTLVEELEQRLDEFSGD